jgi:hypothetical protein
MDIWNGHLKSLWIGNTTTSLSETTPNNTIGDDLMNFFWTQLVFLQSHIMYVQQFVMHKCMLCSM